TTWSRRSRRSATTSRAAVRWAMRTDDELRSLHRALQEQAFSSGSLHLESGSGAFRAPRPGVPIRFCGGRPTAPRVILGLSAYYHDAAAALLVDGAVVAAAHEERFSRKKHDARLPLRAIDYCVQAAGLRISDVDLVAFYEEPLLKGDR